MHLKDLAVIRNVMCYLICDKTRLHSSASQVQCCCLNHCRQNLWSQFKYGM